MSLSLAACQTITPVPIVPPLCQGVRMVIPEDTTLVVQGVLYVLESTHYKLAIGLPASQTSVAIALAPIPPAAFNGQVMTVQAALLMLIGANNRLLVDPVHHLISFEQIPKNNNPSLRIVCRNLTTPLH